MHETTTEAFEPREAKRNAHDGSGAGMHEVCGEDASERGAQAHARLLIEIKIVFEHGKADAGSEAINGAVDKVSEARAAHQIEQDKGLERLLEQRRHVEHGLCALQLSLGKIIEGGAKEYGESTPQK